MRLDDFNVSSIKTAINNNIIHDKNAIRLYSIAV